PAARVPSRKGNRGGKTALVNNSCPSMKTANGKLVRARFRGFSCGDWNCPLDTDSNDLTLSVRLPGTKHRLPASYALCTRLSYPWNVRTAGRLGRLGT